MSRPLCIGLFEDELALIRQKLGAEEALAYLQLILAYARNGGPLPDDDAKLSRFACVPLKRWRAMREEIATMFSIVDGAWRCDKGDAQARIFRERSERARGAVSKRWDRQRLRLVSGGQGDAR